MEPNRKNKVPITRLTKFFDNEDFNLEVDFGREYMEGDLNMTIVLYSVDIEKTDTDDVYKEVKAQDIRFLHSLFVYSCRCIISLNYNHS